MKRFLFIFISLLFCASLTAKEKIKVDFFVRTFCDKAEVHKGDSLLVSYVLYATAPFSEVECKTKMSIKNAKCRPLKVNRRNTLSRSREKGRTYYTMVWEQYVIAPQETDLIKLPELQFDATFSIRPAPRGPFEGFFGNRIPPITVKASAKNETRNIKVTEKPRRTTRELMQEGII